MSNDQLQTGSQAALGSYNSKEGRRVIDSFDITTYPGERDPLAEIGIDAAKLGLTYLLGKYIPTGLAKAEEKVLGKGASGTADISKTAEEIEAIRRMAGNPNGADLSKKAPNTVLNQKMINDLNADILPGKPIGGLGTPREMPASPNPSATAEDFATQLLGRSPTEAERKVAVRMNKGNCEGCWVASPDNGKTYITYRPAGKASDGTLPTTASVEVNFKSDQNSINNGNELKLKFPTSER
ncbi:hypothetical protein [Herbaspirillum rubrisubalbicans]|uniref:hypothetical protein n=1 Tax=Herbaspirillum rubrisubalbicans TaxID=80842 RepID=UPI0011BFD865|nr:hypothetical protein [Herbaspirillum rubrisubalbicans]